MTQIINLISKLINCNITVIFRKFVVIEFDDRSIQLVPRNWIKADQSYSYYPYNQHINPKCYDKMVIQCIPYSTDWKTYKISKIWASSGTNNKYF